MAEMTCTINELRGAIESEVFASAEKLATGLSEQVMATYSREELQDYLKSILLHDGLLKHLYKKSRRTERLRD